MRSLIQDLYSSIGIKIFMHHGAPYFAADPEHYEQILKETV